MLEITYESVTKIFFRKFKILC